MVIYNPSHTYLYIHKQSLPRKQIDYLSLTLTIPNMQFNTAFSLMNSSIQFYTSVAEQKPALL